LFDALIVGSGPAGTFSAFGLRGRRVGLIDVGHEPDLEAVPAGSLSEIRDGRTDLFDLLIGDSFQGLCNISGGELSLKLKAPHMNYIVRGAGTLFPHRSTNFAATVSYAKGGLANAWGAGLYRFNDDDLSEFPISASDLSPLYDELTEHIGVSGANDDLVPFFGDDPNLQPPLKELRLASTLLNRYSRQRERFNSEGMYLGRPRLGVLTQHHRGRSPYQYDAAEFFRPLNPAIYNPAYTLNELRDAGGLEYLPHRFVERYEEAEGHVTLHVRNLQSQTVETLKGRYLFLAAGTLNTARLVLASQRDRSIRLPILDNPMSCLPIFDWRAIGNSDSPPVTSLAQLNMIVQDGDSGEALQGSIYGGAAPLRSDILFKMPLTIGGNVEWLRMMSPATLLVMLFHGGVARRENFVRLSGSGTIEIRCEPERRNAAGALLARLFRRLGFVTSAALCQYPELGTGLHYAGSLPMRSDPGPMETDRYARLSSGKRIFVSDGACFSALPAKNLSLTIMANALRIARNVRQNLLD
jgi:choline dehydrogenase-like flavoprotein